MLLSRELHLARTGALAAVGALVIGLQSPRPECTVQQQRHLHGGAGEHRQHRVFTRESQKRQEQ